MLSLASVDHVLFLCSGIDFAEQIRQMLALARSWTCGGVVFGARSVTRPGARAARRLFASRSAGDESERSLTRQQPHANLVRRVSVRICCLRRRSARRVVGRDFSRLIARAVPERVRRLEATLLETHVSAVAHEKSGTSSRRRACWARVCARACARAAKGDGVVGDENFAQRIVVDSRASANAYAAASHDARRTTNGDINDIFNESKSFYDDIGGEPVFSGDDFAASIAASNATQPPTTEAAATPTTSTTNTTTTAPNATEARSARSATSAAAPGVAPRSKRSPSPRPAKADAATASDDAATAAPPAPDADAAAAKARKKKPAAAPKVLPVVVPSPRLTACVDRRRSRR